MIRGENDHDIEEGREGWQVEDHKVVEEHKAGEGKAWNEDRGEGKVRGVIYFCKGERARLGCCCDKKTELEI